MMFSKHAVNILLLFLILFSGLIHSEVNDPPAIPENRQRNTISVTVDPRVELISIIFHLTGNPEYNKCRIRSYQKDIDQHFQSFRDHALISYTRNLRKNRGVSYDAPMSLAIHLTGIDELTGRIPLRPRPETIDARWRDAELKQFLTLTRQFVQDTDFKSFMDKHQTLHEHTASAARNLIHKQAHLEWFDSFFGPRPNVEFRVIISLVNGPSNYGARIRLPDKDLYYCILGVWKSGLFGTGKPHFDRNMLDTVAHEFAHSYVNPLVYAHLDELKPAGMRLFPIVKNRMKRMAYGSWPTMMHESIVRASVVHYLDYTVGPDRSRWQIQREIVQGFLWMQELSDLLLQYQNQRQTYPAFEAYFPRIIRFFENYQLDEQPNTPESPKPT